MTIDVLCWTSTVLYQQSMSPVSTIDCDTFQVQRSSGFYEEQSIVNQDTIDYCKENFEF